MRKFLSAISILLVLLTVATMIPFTFAAFAAVAAPTTTPDGEKMVLTPVTDGTLTNKGDNVAVSLYASQFEGTTKTVFDNGNLIDTTTSKGMLMRVDTAEGMGNPQWYVIVTYEDGTTYDVRKQPFSWWDGTAWEDGTPKSNNDGNSKIGYLYVDFSNIGLDQSKKISNLKIVSAKSNGTRAGTFSQWSIVQTPAQAESNPLVPAEPSIAAPTTLPDGTTEMFYKSVTDGTLIKAEGASSGSYSKALANKTYSIFEDGTQDLANYKGFIVKAKATGGAKLYLRFKFKLADGSEVEIKSNNRPLAWYDGTSWSSLGGASSNWQTPVGEGYAFLSFPLDEFANIGTEVSDIQVYSSNGTGRVGEFSEWSLVYTADQIITGASVSLTDDLAWNVSVNEPADCTDAKLVFNFNGNTVDAVKNNGKYSLTGILPQQIGLDITATWTGTINGKTYTDTVTSSIEKYCKVLLGLETTADWHELAKALLHYGAAAQRATGYEGVLCNDGIAAVTSPVDLSGISAVAINNDNAVWKSATLRLDGALALKIKLAAPEGVTSVTAMVDGRSETVTLDVVDGYVILPLNAYELSKTVTLSYGDDAKTLVISADYVLKNVTDPAYAELAQAVANYGKEALAKRS